MIARVMAKEDAPMAEVRREELINLSEAAKRVGLARSRMRARVEAGVLPAFRDPLDSRALLVQIEDVDWLRQPVPIVPERDKESRPTRL
jgi:hypothetical protein